MITNSRKKMNGKKIVNKNYISLKKVSGLSTNEKINQIIIEIDKLGIYHCINYDGNNKKHFKIL